MTEQPPLGQPPYGPPPDGPPPPPGQPPAGPQPPGYQPASQERPVRQDDRPWMQPKPDQPPPGGYPPGQQGPDADARPALPPAPSQLGTWLVLAVVLAGLVAGGIWWLRGQTAVDDLRVGDCLTSDDLKAGNADVAAVDVVDCNDPHDGEVVAGLVIDDATAKDGYSGSVGAQECAKLSPELAAKSLELRPLAPDRDLVVGDKVPCIARNADGSPLTGTLVSPGG